ncbi:8481_t:CDS:2, partial [Racocetra persica]
FGSEEFALKPNNSIVLKVPENLPQDSVIVVSFKNPPSNYEPNFIAKMQSYQDNKILFNVRCLNYESSDSNEDSEDYSDENNEDYDDENSESYSEENNENSKFFNTKMNENMESSGFSEDGVNEEGSNSKYIDVNDKKSASKDALAVSENINNDKHNYVEDNLVTNKSEEHLERNYVEDSNFIDDRYEDFDSNDIEIADFGYEERPSEKSPKYLIQWFILQNSDTTNSFETMHYLNKIGQEVHLKTKSRLPYSIKTTSKNQLNNRYKRIEEDRRD